MATATPGRTPADGRLPREQLVAFLTEMLLIRRFEEKVEERFRAGDLAGFLHADIGQEAVAVGVCSALQNNDTIASTHRAHGHVIANGTPANEVMAELYGKVEGCSHGYGGSMHLYDVARGNMGANAVVGGGLPAVVGGALAFKMKGQQRVAVAFFGDGATNTGVFHESLNLAQLWMVPAVFVCENNRWSESTPQWQHQPIRDLTQRAVAFGMRAVHVDGQDVEAVHLAALDALEYARSGKGPVFLLCETERLTGHYIGDAQVYRDKDELKRLRQTRDPITNLRERLDLSDKDWDRLDAEAQQVADDAVEFAKSGTDPAPADALEHIYAEER
jgi:acetoin:2,6-dichlorophenolindophenol oxidoreductase subunit alpha